MSNITLHQRFNRFNITDKHLELLDMLLEGKTKRQMLDHLFPDRKTEYSGVSKYEDMVRDIAITFGAPFKISKYKKYKDVVIKNREVYLKYLEDKKEFIRQKKELERQIQDLKEKEIELTNSKEDLFSDISFESWK